MAADPDILVEREDGLAAVEGLFDQVRGGEGALVVVEGPAGIGKSRFLATVRERWGGRTLAARGGELERDVAHGIARALFERVLHALPRAERAEMLAGSAALAAAAVGLPEEAPTSASPDTGPLHGLYWLTANLAASTPLLLVVDDAHWADAESLRYLVYLARRLAGLPVLVALAARVTEPEADRTLLDHLRGEPGVQHVALAPLTASGTRRMLAAGLGAPPDAGVTAACQEVTGGNPFFVREVVETLAAEPGLAPEDVVARVHRLVPPAVQRTIQTRLRQQTPDVQAVGAALAVAGDLASVAVLAQAADVDEPAVRGALRRLADVGLAARSGAPALKHPIVRSAVYEQIPETNRRYLHEIVARTLLAQGMPTRDVASHLLFTDPGVDPEVAAVLLDAGQDALGRGATRTAYRLLDRALAERATPEPPSACLLAVATAAIGSGEDAAARGHLRRLLARESLAGDARADAALMLARLLASADDEAGAMAVLADAAPGLDGDQALRLDVERASLTMYLAEGRVLAVHHQLTPYAALPGVTAAQRLALAVTSLARAIGPEATAAEVADISRRALGGGRLITELTTDSTVPQDVLHALEFTEDLDLHDEAVAQGFADAQERGSMLGFFMLSLTALASACLRGRTGEAVAHGEAALRTLPDVPDRLVVKFWTSSVRRFLAESLVQRGRLDEAQALLLAAREPATTRHGGYARGLLANALGDHATAITELEAYREFCAEAQWEARDCPWRIELAVAHHALGRSQRAVAIADEAVEIARRWGAPGGLGDALWARAAVGDPAETVERLAAAVAVLRPSVRELVLARALVDHGSALRRAGQRTQARDVLEEGMGLATRCGADPLAERARDELRILGARPRRLRHDGLDGLTASERRVADLASSGLTNREIGQTLFVSGKTVETHLARVYRKLDISSREQLPTALAS